MGDLGGQKDGGLHIGLVWHERCRVSNVMPYAVGFSSGRLVDKEGSRGRVRKSAVVYIPGCVDCDGWWHYDVSEFFFHPSGVRFCTLVI